MDVTKRQKLVSQDNNIPLYDLVDDLIAEVFLFVNGNQWKYLKIYFINRQRNCKRCESQQEIRAYL